MNTGHRVREISLRLRVRST